MLQRMMDPAGKAELDLNATSSCASISSACGTIPSILSLLRAAPPSDLAKKRKIEVHRPVGKRATSGPGRMQIRNLFLHPNKFASFLMNP